ncbi:MAG: endonuclease [Anaerolineae bacterium]|nr:endonuclease [Anaerolineae bacterium]
MEDFERFLRETEHRYHERRAARTASERKIKAGKILEADAPRRVALRLRRLGISLTAAARLAESGLRVPAEPFAAAFVPPESVTMERILGRNEMLGVNFLEMGLSASHSVARVRIKNSDDRVLGFGTGFMVSPHLLITNNHVLHSATEALYSDVEFNYEIGIDGLPVESRAFPLNPDAFFLTNRQLDYSLVAVGAVDHEEDLDQFGWNVLIQEEGTIITGECLNIVQHPNGEPKQLALRENNLVDVLDDFFHYRTDTAPGSSGSPVFNDQWEVVALHHSGIPRRDSEGRILTKYGQIWYYQMGEHQIDWIANEGVRVDRILQHVKSQALPPDQVRLLSQMLNATRTPNTLPDSSPEPDKTPSKPDMDDGSSDKEKYRTWTVPLQMILDVDRSGQPMVSSVQSVAVPAAQLADEDLREALQELKNAENRPYYDEAADMRARDMFYAEIEQSSTPQDLFRNLSALIRSCHTPTLDYKPILHIYPWIDLRSDLMLQSIYSGKVCAPEEFIIQDISINHKRAARMYKLMNHDSTFQAELLQQELTHLEAELPYNCEHAVPQSWFSRQQPMRGDLHHLFACEAGCNSLRSDYAYSDFADIQEAQRTDCGKTLESRFEPGAGKGAVARATLYFLLRYPGAIRADQHAPDQEHLTILLDWHEHFPVTVYEKHRNKAIFEKQGNRNPLIDFPEIARRVDFTLSLARQQDR